VDGKEFVADPEEKRLYDDAIATLRGGDFAAAATSLQGFVRRFPASGYIDSARFWLGNALYGKRDYKEAVATFRAFANAAPSHPRAPRVSFISSCSRPIRSPRPRRRARTVWRP